jgi:hypothetical protein
MEDFALGRWFGHAFASQHRRAADVSIPILQQT